MEVKTKFNINDNIWVIYDNKVVRQKIKGIEISVDTENEPEIIYTLLEDKRFPESRIYKNKEELIDSL